MRIEQVCHDPCDQDINESGQACRFFCFAGSPSAPLKCEGSNDVVAKKRYSPYVEWIFLFDDITEVVLFANCRFLIVLFVTVFLCSCASIENSEESPRLVGYSGLCEPHETAVYQPPVRSAGAPRVLRVENDACLSDLDHTGSEVCGPMSPSFYAVLSREAKLQLGDRAFRLEAFPYPPEEGQEIFENQISPRFVTARFTSDELTCWANTGDQVASYIVAEEILEKAFSSEVALDKSNDLLLAKQLLDVASRPHPKNCATGLAECESTVRKIFPFGIPDAHRALVELSGEFGLSASEARDHLKLAVRGGSLLAYEMLTGIKFIRPIR